jgi:hypothetical protein
LLARHGDLLACVLVRLFAAAQPFAVSYSAYLVQLRFGQHANIPLTVPNRLLQIARPFRYNSMAGMAIHCHSSTAMIS